MVGMLMTGIFATKAVNSAGAEGLAYGETALFVKHLIAMVAVSVFAFVGAFILLKITDLISPLRVTPAEELIGLDASQHDEGL
jgi:Amt family ammonium transporter